MTFSGMTRLGAVVGAGAILVATTAAAVEVEVGGVTYDVSTFSGSYSANSEKFDSASMPWWGDRALAKSIRDAYLGATSPSGTYFAYTDELVADRVTAFQASTTSDTASDLFFSDFATYATATIVPAEIPEIDGPVFVQLLAVLGAGWLMAARRREQDAAAA